MLDRIGSNGAKTIEQITNVSNQSTTTDLLFILLV